MVSGGLNAAFVVALPGPARLSLRKAYQSILPCTFHRSKRFSRLWWFVRHLWWLERLHTACSMQQKQNVRLHDRVWYNLEVR